MQCIHFGDCGGCALRDKPYNEQVTYKQELIKNLFFQTDLIDLNKIKIVPSPATDYYRNKMEYSFGIWDDALVLGLHAKKKYYKVIDIEECYMHSPESIIALKTIRTWAKENKIQAYHKKRRTGILRHLVIKDCKFEKRIIINLIALKKIDVDLLAEKLKENIPQSSFYFGINTQKADTAINEELFHIYGNNTLEEKIGEYYYKFGMNNFFQVNPLQLENIFEYVKKIIPQGECLIDLYCGVGGFGIFLANGYNKVIGIEFNKDSIEFAKQNAKLNNISNIEFVSMDVKDCFNDIRSASKDITMIVDPPRAGLGRKVTEQILNFLPSKLLYVSCNPKTMIQDMELLNNLYCVKEFRVFDMFPHTAHVESVALLEKRK